MKTDMVNKPPHYNGHPSGLECKDIAAYFPSQIANAIKYMWRYEDKGKPVEDLLKCQWYLTEVIDNTNHEFTYEGLLIAKKFIPKKNIDKFIKAETNPWRLEFMKQIKKCLDKSDIGYLEKALSVVSTMIVSMKENKNDSI